MGSNGMNRAKKISALVLGIAYLFFSSGLALADSRPYFRAYGADIFSGGWFNSGANSCSPAASTFQAPTYSGLTNLYKGGIMTYAKNNGGGAGSQFGAEALGLIEGNNGSEPLYGFTSGSGGYNKLSFANSSSLSVTNFWGGFWEGSDAHQASHCLPDYFGTKQNSPKPWSGSLSAAASGQYSSGSLTLSTDTISAGKNITIFVSGDVYISGTGITYASGYTADNVPKFALVVKGNIYIAPTVTRMDGLYIAQPDTTNDTTINNSGVIWTCHDSTTTVPPDTYVRSNCGSKLTINGSIIAKQVAFLRIGGDLAGAGPNEPAGSGNIAEVINYSPEMVIGGGFFNSVSSGYKIESLISLPPVF